MATLKEVRIKAGMTQPQLAEIIKSNAPMISNYENGIALPELEDMFLLETYFSEKISFHESYTPLEKHNLNQNIIELLERYPAQAVAEFVIRTFRRNTHPENLIRFYAQQATKDDVEPLYPLLT